MQMTMIFFNVLIIPSFIYDHTFIMLCFSTVRPINLISMNVNLDIYLMSKRVFVVGVGMTPFLKPSNKNPDYPEMARVAITRALADANVSYDRV
jgi:hypothetical protein